MTLSPSKIALLARLNNQAQNEHEAAKDLAMKKGRPAPPAPVLLTEHGIEFPKWVGKDWKPSGKAPGHHEAAKSQLASNKEEFDILLTQGWSVKPSKATTQEPPPKGAVKGEAEKGDAPPKTAKPKTESTKQTTNIGPTATGKDNAKAQ